MGLLCKLLIQMSGAPGSGKSTLANLLGQSIDGIVINHDLIKTFFLGNGESFDLAGKQAYRFQWVLTEDMIKQGRSVIIDSTCNYKETLDQGTMLAQKYGYDYKYVECRVNDIDLLDERLQNRDSLRSQRKGVNRPPLDVSSAHHNSNHRALFKRWIENPCRPARDTIIVDSTESPEKCLEHVLKQIVPPAGL